MSERLTPPSPHVPYSSAWQVDQDRERIAQLEQTLDQTKRNWQELRHLLEMLIDLTEDHISPHISDRVRAALAATREEPSRGMS